MPMFIKWALADSVLKSYLAKEVVLQHIEEPLENKLNRMLDSLELANKMLNL